MCSHYIRVKIILPCSTILYDPQKGENISAQEVEHELSKSTNFDGTIVAVGLKLENFDGYPPMIVLDSKLSGQDFRLPDNFLLLLINSECLTCQAEKSLHKDTNVQKLKSAIENLPRSKQPLFVRWTKTIPLTPTFKIKREQLKQVTEVLSVMLSTFLL